MKNWIILVLFSFPIMMFSQKDTTKITAKDTILSPRITDIVTQMEKDYPRPYMGHIPDFVAYNYSFHIATKQIGYLCSYVHPMSSSGIGTYYFGIMPEVDYDTFEVISEGLAKDKNRYYLANQPSMMILKDTKINIKTNTGFHKYAQSLKAIQKNSITIIYPGTSSTIKYSHLEVINDIVFKRKSDDSVFVADEYDKYKIVKNPNFDLKTLKHISGRIFQDKKDLFWLYEGDLVKIENEQIVDSQTYTEETGEDPQHWTIFIGKKGFYLKNDKISNYQLKSYHFIKNTNYYFYNDYLYYFNTKYGSSDYPVGVNGQTIRAFNVFEEGLGDKSVGQRDFKKVKILGKNAILYDSKELFYQNNAITYDKKIDISQLEYLGELPHYSSVEITPVSTEYGVFSYNKKLYSVGGGTLNEITKVTLDNVKFDLPTLKILNEYYLIDKKNFFTSYQMSRNNYPKITSKDLDLSKLRAFDKYFTDGKNIYYNCKKIDPKRDSANLDGSFPRHANTLRQFKTKNNELINIDFSRLKIIKNNDIATNNANSYVTEYLTDEKYLIFKENIIGIIDYKTLKVLGNNYIEDKNQYFYCDYSILKKDLKGK